MIQPVRLFYFCLPLLALLALPACTVNPATGKQSFTGFMSRADEMRVGRQEHPKILKSFGGIYDDRDIMAYVRRIAISLTKVSEITDLPYTISVLNDEKVNAFALPGGYIYITRGLIALTENEAEMAGVLAHEIGHITARHSAQRYSKVQAANIGMTLLGVLGGSGGQAVNNLLSVYARVALQSYSREQEMEADMLAVRYLVRAGYSPKAMVSFLKKMQRYTKLLAKLSANPQIAERNNSIMSTHPRTADRVLQAIKLSKTVNPNGAFRLGREDFLRHIDGLMFGDDPKQGVRRGREFAHPGLRIRFEVPPGFVMFNSPDKVLARGPNGASMVFSMEGADNAKNIADLLTYVRDYWAKGLSLKGLQRIQVNGMEAVTGYGRMRNHDGSLKDVRLLAVRQSRERIYRFAFLTPPAFTARMITDFQRVTYSFRRLLPDEVAAIRPLRLRVVSVKKGATAASMAENMPFEKGGLELFEILNGLNHGQPLIPGDKVKVIGD